MCAVEGRNLQWFKICLSLENKRELYIEVSHVEFLRDILDTLLFLFYKNDLHKASMTISPFYFRKSIRNLFKKTKTDLLKNSD